MKYIILGAWVIQAVAGSTLLSRWARHARGANTSTVLTHVVIMLACVAGWVTFVVTETVLWAWLSWGVLAVGIPFGEVQMVGRIRHHRGETSPGMRDYGHAIRGVFTGALPSLVAFHAMFSAVVFFGSLGVAIGATIAV